MPSLKFVVFVTLNWCSKNPLLAMSSSDAPKELRDDHGIKLAESSSEYKRAKHHLQVSVAA
jgi:hypothetical protein